MDDSTRELILRLSMVIKILVAALFLLMGIILFLLRKMGKLTTKDILVLIALAIGTFALVLFFTLK